MWLLTGFGQFSFYKVFSLMFQDKLYKNNSLSGSVYSLSPSSLRIKELTGLIGLTWLSLLCTILFPSLSESTAATHFSYG